MEQQLEKLLTDVSSQPDTVGCLLTNNLGLCIGSKGKINPSVSGVAVAISELAAKLDPKQDPPSITLHAANRRCVIQTNGDLTAVVYKQSDK